METITTYLNGNVTLFDIAAVIVGWLLFNAGFFAGAAWKGMFSEQPEPQQPIARPKFRARMWVG